MFSAAGNILNFPCGLRHELFLLKFSEHEELIFYVSIDFYTELLNQIWYLPD